MFFVIKSESLCQWNIFFPRCFSRKHWSFKVVDRFHPEMCFVSLHLQKYLIPLHKMTFLGFVSRAEHVFRRLPASQRSGDRKKGGGAQFHTAPRVGLSSNCRTTTADGAASPLKKAGIISHKLFKLIKTACTLITAAIFLSCSQSESAITERWHQTRTEKWKQRKKVRRYYFKVVTLIVLEGIKGTESVGEETWIFL